ncbi:MAG: hypothetical protein J3K34DRAFT_460173 [Monoraphidium minutum]|nr:MAG: hypothetical protein J3K34DRAFT_460173 [Monoraphidium minutum]
MAPPALSPGELLEDEAVAAAAAGGGAEPCVLDAARPDAWAELQAQIRGGARGWCLGLLMAADAPAAAKGGGLARFYFSSSRGLSKQQVKELRRALRGGAATAAAAAAAAADDDGGGGGGAGAGGGAAGGGGGGLPAGANVWVAGVVLLPIHDGNAAALSAAPAAPPPRGNWRGPPGAAAAVATAAPAGGGGGGGAGPCYLLLAAPGGGALAAPGAARALMAVLTGCGRGAPCVACNAKGALVALAGLGLELPAAAELSVVDPLVLQSGEYLLDGLLARYCPGQEAAPDDARPLRALAAQLAAAARLADALQPRLSARVSARAIRLEAKMAGVLARMELAGIACCPAVLADHRPAIVGRMAAIQARAEELVGRPFNLSSASQLAAVLYEELRLPLPTNTGGRGAAKTHAPTDEAALRELAPLHELPGLVIENRALINLCSKWLDAGWVRAAAAEAAAAEAAGGPRAAGGGGGVARVRCCWHQTGAATGRLSCSSPNLQAVTRYTLEAEAPGEPAAAGGPTAAAAAVAGPAAVAAAAGADPLALINVRGAFVAPAGRLLVSADYSQVELRLLAHFSGDDALCGLLRRGGDVLAGIAESWLRDPSARDTAKRVVYGICYGITPWGLAAQLRERGVSVQDATRLIESFLGAFPGVRRYISSLQQQAERDGGVTTLLGRWRPIDGLGSGDAKVRAAALRRVVNSQIQGSAADLLKLAMAAWDDYDAAQRRAAPAAAPPGQQQQQQAAGGPGGPDGGGGGAEVGAAAGPAVAWGRCVLVASIHDELIFEVEGGAAAAAAAGAAAAEIMRAAAGPLAVPLEVKVQCGPCWAFDG